jgi:uncharacterized protein (DUF433 family)
MNKMGQSSARIRVQIDLKPDQVRLLETLEEKLALRSRSDLVQEAIGLLSWFVQETLRGRRVMSVDPEDVDRLGKLVELVVPFLMVARGDVYEHLVARPNRGLHQLWLKGRNITVGQLVATIRANKLSSAEAAQDLELPEAQVREALAYYDGHHEMVDAELREQREWLKDRGYVVEPPPLPR